MPHAELLGALDAYRDGDLDTAERRLGGLRTGAADHLRGLIAHQRGQHADAVAHLLDALSRREDPLWRANLGIVYLDMDDNRRAAMHLRRAIAGDPELVSAHSNLSAALLALSQPQAALEAAATALSLDPHMAEAYNNLGAALQMLGRLDDARAAFQAAIDHNPGDSDYTCNMGILDLLAGRTAQGWARYEARDIEGREPPRWEGEPLDGPLLLFSEQGYGDTLQFCRYAPLLAARGVPVWLEVPASLHPLLRSLGEGIRLVTHAEGAEAHRSAPLMSLPLILGPDEADCPRRVPYLSAEPDRIARWRDRLPGGRVRVGVSWQGNPTAQADVGRSFPLRLLADALADLDGVTLISLQRGAGAEQLTDGGPVHRLPGLDEPLGGFRDTAAVMAQLDLVISADTATAHLAGALGRPVWVALRHSPDWRWQMERSDSPWYPTARLFRQPRHGDWPPVFAQMRDALARL